MSKENALTDDEHEALRKLATLVGENATVFDSQQVVIILKMIELYKGFAFFGRLGAGMRNVIIWAAAMLGAWFAFNEWIINFIRKAGH